MPSLPQPGQVVHGYRVQRELGRGGMGVVFEAEQIALGRTVALKVLSPGSGASEELRDRFAREARTAAGIDHPNVVPIHDHGSDGDRLWIAMRLVRGEDLGHRLREQGALPPSLAVDVVEQVADALDAAHAAGLVHRDVKPGNVLLEEGTGTARGASALRASLTDFGITKALDAASTELTNTHQLLGTADGMAPEQIEGGHVDARTDVYALACVLYEALAARPAFTGTAVAKLYAHVNADRPRPSDANPALAPFDAVIARGMARDPQQRPPSAGDLARSARAAIEGGSAGEERTVAVGDALHGERTQAMVQAPRGRGPAAAGAAGAAAGAAAAAGTWDVPTSRHPTAGTDASEVPWAAPRPRPPAPTPTPPAVPQRRPRAATGGEAPAHTIVDRPPEDPAGSGGPGRRRTVAIAAAAVVLLGVVAAVALLALGTGQDDGGRSATGTERDARPATSTEAQATSTEEAPPTTEEAAPTTEEAPPTTQEVAPPTGGQAVSGTGWTATAPGDGWTQETTEDVGEGGAIQRTTWRRASDGALLLVDHTPDQPSAVEPGTQQLGTLTHPAYGASPIYAVDSAIIPECADGSGSCVDVLLNGADGGYGVLALAGTRQAARRVAVDAARSLSAD